MSRTDNAYVGVSSALVTPLTSGAALSVPVHDTQMVKQGDALVTIDPQDAKLAVAQADAAYGLAMRRVQGYFAAWRRARPTTSAPSSITNGAPSSAIPARFRATSCRRRKTISNPPRRRSTGRRR